MFVRHLGRTRRRASLVLALAALGMLPGSAASRDFRVGEVEGLLDLTLAYGVLARVEAREPKLVGIANGGKAPSVNSDNGTLNYDTGVASNMLKATTELTLVWRNLGGYVRAFGFYDFENDLADRERTSLTSGAKRQVGWQVDVADYYLNAAFTPGGVPVWVRVGNQLINWGESRFLRLGVDVVNPIDLVAALQPVSTPRDLFVPQGMVWAGAVLSETVSVEGFYQYDWKSARLPPVGSYFSTNDALGAGGLGSTFGGAGLFSDLGTDLDAAFELPPGTLGFDPDFYRFDTGGRKKPHEQGQFGFTARAILPFASAPKLALHFVNYHARLPLISGRTAGPLAISETSQEAVDERAAELEAVYLDEGLPPAEAAAMAQASASTLTIGHFTNATSYFVSYPENTQMLGLSFNTSTIRTGTLVSGEVSHHFDLPLQVWVPDVLTAALSPIEFDPSFGEGRLGSFGPNEVVRGFVKRDKTQLELGLTQLLGPRLGATQTVVSFDVGWVHIHDVPPKRKLLLQAPGVTSTDRPGRFPDADSWGYRLSAALQYTGVLGGLNVVPYVLWTQDVDGTTPGPLNAFVAGRKSVSVGLGVNWTNTVTTELSWTSFFGAGPYNLLADRDFIRFNVKYYY